ncbi:hypothetical protein DAPPUDRAFT_300912 [Daphnia pulex]|uniref:Phosphatidylinositol 4,5-bisphosphate 3-kinase catalytic subunit alpha isoform n=1 Tax=Daphnia pulex TaxID=6669 RepID=E9HFD3_DAPPU|nr:hypothetical protein DAPPUDRAFT_300912 [Daphnia pulex]|eukprot:EFX69553.1 hypothetical protein DAPPUDRAFT_300912 [Daphnia pulex]
MPPSSGELWGHPVMPSSVLVDCLLPNGIVIQLGCVRDAPLNVIKGNLWREAKKHPLFYLLGDPSTYIFVSISHDAEQEEFYDESRRLCDLRLFLPLLKIIEPQGNKMEKILNSEIGLAVGVAIHELDEMKDPEVQDFRRNIMQVCKECAELRDLEGLETQALFAYPAEVETKNDFPSSIEKKLDRGEIILCIWQLANDGADQQKLTVRVSKDAFPETVVAEAIGKKSKSLRMSREQQIQLIDEHQKSFVLKVCGTQEFLLERYAICQYKYIRHCLAKGEIPQLCLFSRREVYASLPENTLHIPSYMRRTLPNPPTGNSLSLWQLNNLFRVHILWATYVNVRDVDMIYVRAGLYHGQEPLCSTKESQQVPFNSPKWHQWLTFELNLVDLPRGARLCLSICSVTKRKKREEHCMLAWGNINMFDYRNSLLTGKVSLSLWTVPKGMDALLNHLGTTGSNPNKDAPCLEVEFDRVTPMILYPDSNAVEEYGRFVTSIPIVGTSLPTDSAKTTSNIEGLLEIQAKDPLSELSEQEKDMLWEMRHVCCKKVPDALPKLLEAVKWNSRDNVAQMFLLLNVWPPVAPETALELLDCKYADPSVRKLAVRWLDKSLSNDTLGQFLLQLVQTLKYEPYLDNELSRFLLKRSLLNKKIGHFFFWHLKSEMNNPSISLRFGILLEAYCRGIGGHLKGLLRQVEALDKLTKLTDVLKVKKDEPLKDRMKYLCESVSQSDYVDALQNFTSPLNGNHTLGSLVADNCRIMDSAKRPLWLIWKNPDPLGHAIQPLYSIIFKNGDDLRQDMLTLQVIRIMDSIWLNEGLDLRMMPYACLSTGKDVGMIEVVRQAKTVYGIQRQGGKLAAIQVDSTQLHKWIKEKNKGPKYEQAIETFTHSCAGYCVATFILGIGDRNPDNIMVNEDGSIFHIDFGHFLGHFKKKFGINRERVPFVLTEDFLYVISKGVENPTKSKAFQLFQELCGRAYLVLRRHANLLITLFIMMLPTGIPELQSVDDIGYLRKTLAVEKTEEKALEYFQNQLFEAYGGAWTTKLDWFFHSVKHM